LTPKKIQVIDKKPTICVLDSSGTDLAL